MINLFNVYLTNFIKVSESLNKTEESYYESFRQFLSFFFPENKGYSIQVNTTDSWTHNIKISYLDRPDFIILKRKIPILRIEAKIPDDNIEKNLKANSNDRLHEQIYRYRGREGNTQPVAITDFKILWVIDKDQINEIGKDPKIHKKITIINEDNTLNKNLEQELVDAFDYLTNDAIISITKLQNLIEPLAEYTKYLHDEIYNITSNENVEDDDLKIKLNLKSLSEDLKNTIFRDREIEDTDQFADFFSQTIIYTAFLGWIRFCLQGNKSELFEISLLPEYLPGESFIHKIFLNLKSILSNRLYDDVILAIEGLFCGTNFNLLVKNIDVLLSTFYSDFLNLYDAKKAKNLGVIFTPTEIVDYMVHGVDQILIKFFNRPDGIISPEISFLDPASGTMSFACSIIRKAYELFESNIAENENNLSKDFKNWIENHFLKNMYAFEILMAPYVLGHLKTMISIEDYNIDIDWTKFKLKSYLMNTLMERPKESLDFFLKTKEFKEEILKALETRHSSNIMVILGNPPYNISSQNTSSWIERKMIQYKAGLTERNLKILSDDYIKFIRFSHWKIAETNKMGIVALITNNKYFYGEIFRKMRRSLKKDFDIIYTINLHGDYRKGEKGNPFDIMVGVGIIFLIRLTNHSDDDCKVYALDIPDSSKYAKFNKLNNGFDFNSFRRVNNDRYLIEIDSSLEIETEFNSYYGLTDLFRYKPQSGIMSGRDGLVYNVSESELKENYILFFNKKFQQLKNKLINVKDTKNWKIQNAILKFSDEPPNIIKVNYRGFDTRFLLYDERLVEGHRKGYINQISQNNPAISTTKSVRKGKFSHCLATLYPVEKCFVSVNDTSYVFPLKLNNEFNIIIPNDLDIKINPKELFYYIYAILFSNFYRTRYSSQLLRNFPRIPIFNDISVFKELSNLGFRLMETHFFSKGYEETKLHHSNHEDYTVYDDFYYDDEDQKIYFGKSHQAFWIGNISPSIWNYEIGGIKQIFQWLKSRRYSINYKKKHIRRSLNSEEVKFILNLCYVIKITIEFSEKIDLIVKKQYEIVK